MTEPHLEYGHVAPAEPEPAPESPSRRRRTVFLAAGGVALAAALGVGAIYGPTAWRIYQQKDASLTTPNEAAGFRLDESESASDTADYLRAAVGATFGMDDADTIGAVYSNSATPSRSVIIAGGTTLLRSPGDDLTRAFKLLADSASAVEQVHDVPAGELGGVMRCGQTSGPQALTVCGWADHGSLAIAVFPDRPVDDSAQVLRSIRHEIQHRD